MVRVLVTDSNYKHALAATRALSSQGFEVQTIGEARGQASISSSTKKHHPLGFESQLGFVRSVNGIVHAEKISALLPIGARSVAALASHRPSLEEPVGLALPSKDTLELALNKGGLLTFAKEVGLTCPPTWAFHSRKDLIDGLSALPPQLVVKSASELHKFGPIYLWLKFPPQSFPHSILKSRSYIKRVNRYK